MLWTKLENCKILLGINPSLDTAIQWLSTQNLETLEQLPEGRSEISKNCYVVKILSENFNKSNALCEVHKKYGDIHVAISHENETISFAPKDKNVILEGTYNPSTDTILAPFFEQENKIELSRGEIIVFWPQQVHCPKWFKTGKNYKIIVKFLVEDL